MIFRSISRIAGALVLALATAGPALADPGTLRARYDQLREALRHNDYARPIYIDSAEAGDKFMGDVYAVLDAPFETVSRTLSQPGDWCSILTLPFNSKYCQPIQNGRGLDVRIARRPEQPVSEAYRVTFALQRVASRQNYFEARLMAPDGPVGTSDYLINLQAIPLGNGKTFMRLSYSYAVSGMGRFAMQAYLATAGADKVGFTRLRDASGQVAYIGGARGAIERNAMRYYLAIEAHLRTLDAPAEQQLDQRLDTWFNSTERYARQLREMDRATYMSLKRGDFERQQQARAG